MEQKQWEGIATLQFLCLDFIIPLLWLSQITRQSSWGGSWSLCSRHKHPATPDEAESCVTAPRSLRFLALQAPNPIFYFSDSWGHTRAGRISVLPREHRANTTEGAGVLVHSKKPRGQVLNLKRKQHHHTLTCSLSIFFWFLIALFLRK